MRNLVVGAAELEAEDRLEVLALDEHLVPEPPRQSRRQIERRLLRHVVHAAGQDVVQQRRQERVGGGGVGHGSSIVTPSRRPGPDRSRDLRGKSRRAGGPGGILGIPSFFSYSLMCQRRTSRARGPKGHPMRAILSTVVALGFVSHLAAQGPIVPRPRHRQPSPP